MARVWDSTETERITQFVPTPRFVARRTVELPVAGLKPVTGERMLSEHQGELRFVLRTHGPSTYTVLSDTIERQERRWAEARQTAKRFDAPVIEAIRAYKQERLWMKASRFLMSREPMSRMEALGVVQVVWADAESKT